MYFKVCIIETCHSFFLLDISEDSLCIYFVINHTNPENH